MWDPELEMMSALALYFAFDDDDKQPPRKRRVWVKPWLSRRKAQRCYENLMRELTLEDAESYRSWIPMDTNTFEELLSLVRPHISKQDTNFRQAIRAGERLAVTLRHLATGETHKSLEFQFRVAHNTISLMVHEVCKAIFQVLCDRYLKVPQGHEEGCNVASQFYELWQYPNCIGALDGKHVVIAPPPRTGALYRNYKSTFSIVLMALVVADLRFLYVDVGRNGRMNDSSVWGQSKMRSAIESGQLGIPGPKTLPASTSSTPFVIVGDEGFGLKPYLMRPYGAKDLHDEKRIFNYRYTIGEENDE
ncbi:uncharacterized protein LOC135384640 [Ornithodoros turicata]|uniref:uncharacterized protein LOC135384640 n=1 Tax=Ornithodoros turicata TaxID=34597 RepID=UPI0031396504